MEQNEIMNSLSARIISTGYDWAEEFYEKWDVFLSKLDKRMYTEEELDQIYFKNEDGSPSYDVILDMLTFGLGFAKADKYSEDIIGDDASEEEENCYNNMTDDEVASLLEKGMKKFLKTKYKDSTES